MSEGIDLQAPVTRLRAAAEDLADLQTYDRAKAALAAGENELIPADYANRLLAGESLLRVYRELRGLTQAALAEKAKVNRVTVAEIETRCKQGSVRTLRALAGALGVSLDDLAAQAALSRPSHLLQAQTRNPETHCAATILGPSVGLRRIPDHPAARGRGTNGGR